MTSVAQEMHDTGSMYEEVELGGYMAIFTDNVEDKRWLEPDAVVLMHVSWKGKNPGVDVALSVDAIAQLRKTLAQVARKAKRLQARRDNGTPRT